MFGLRRRTAPPAEPVVASIAAEVIAAAYPDELDLLPRQLANSGAGPRRLRAPVGTGVDLMAATPALVSALSFVAAAAAGNLVEAAVSRLSAPAYEKLARVFGRRGAAGAAGTDADPVWQELTALWITLLVDRGMRLPLAETTAAEIVAAMRRRNPPA